MSKRMRREREKTEVLSESERLIHSELVITFPAVERHGRFGGGPLFVCESAASSTFQRRNNFGQGRGIYTFTALLLSEDNE